MCRDISLLLESPRKFTNLKVILRKEKKMLEEDGVRDKDQVVMFQSQLLFSSSGGCFPAAVVTHSN